MHILILQLHTSQLHDDPQPCLPSPWQCWKRSSWRRRSWRRKWRQRPRRLGRGKRRKQSQTACSVPKIEGDVHNSFCANNSCYNCTSIPWGSEFYPDCCCALQHSRLHLLLVCYCPTFLEARDCLHFRKNGISRCWIGVHTNDGYVSPRLSFMDHPLNLSLFIVDLRLEDIHHLMYRTQVK